MKNIVTNAYIFTDKKGLKRLFAEVLESAKYPTGHHIVTSDIVEEDLQNGVIKTYTGSVYYVQKFLDSESFKSYVLDKYDKNSANYYLYVVGLGELK